MSLGDQRFFFGAKKSAKGNSILGYATPSLSNEGHNPAQIT